jgi:hypothetical protein
MRSDMAKVLVERPRLGPGERGVPGKGYRKRTRAMIERDGGTPTREGIRRPYTHHRKYFNEHLGPLRRFVQSRIGRPWDKVYAEISAHIDRGNVVQKHILTHLADYVLTRVVLIDGVPCYGDAGSWWGSRYGRPLRELNLRQIAYVCPKTGLLRRTPRPRKPQPTGRPVPPDSVRVNKLLQCRFLDGRWELVTLAPLPDDWHRANSPATDVVLGRPVRDLTESEARRH